MRFFACGVVLGFACAGCLQQPKGMERYVPTPEVGRAAVGSVLTAWQQGLPTGSIPGTKPQVCVVDNARRAEQRLAKYEILGEVAAQDGRCFAVRVALENPDEKKFIRYTVLGIDPLWVYRQDSASNFSPWLRPMDMDGNSEGVSSGPAQSGSTFPAAGQPPPK